MGNLDAGRRLDVVVAAPGAHDSARVKVLDGLTGAAISAFRTAGRGFAGGVNVGTLNFGGRTGDELALAPSRARGPGATVLDTSPLRFSRGVGAAGPVRRRSPIASPRLARGSFLAGVQLGGRLDRGRRGGQLRLPLSLSIPPIQRLAIYDTASGTFQPVQPGDSRLAGKDITVIVHGWAPGYLDWVNYEASKGHVLKWWETFPGQPGYDPAAPEPRPGLGLAAPGRAAGHDPGRRYGPGPGHRGA